MNNVIIMLLTISLLSNGVDHVVGWTEDKAKTIKHNFTKDRCDLKANVILVLCNLVFYCKNANF